MANNGRLPAVAIVLLASVVGVSQARAAHVRVSNPNAVGIEFFGRGLLYSFYYDRVASDDMVAGFGFGTVSMHDLAGNDTGKTATLVPVYLNYYFIRDGMSPFLTAGATIVADADDVKNLKSSVGGIEFGTNALMPSIGFGFESRTDAGFLVRGTAYGIYGKKLQPWLGITFGYCF